MRGSGSATRGRKGRVNGEGGSLDGGGKFKMMCWNVAGWSRGDGGGDDRGVENRDIRAKVINFFQPDVVCLTETWLKGNEGVVFDEYEWFGHNRVLVSRKAVRGSGGVGVLVKNVILQDWSVKVIDMKLEDVMWVKLEHKETSHAVFIAVCYFPPASSSRDIDIEERFHVLGEQVVRFQMEGQVMVCGDFNARCGELGDSEGIPSRCCVDIVKNSQGELLVDWMRSSGLVFVNGRQGEDQFTCISSRGRSVVDYCLVPEEELMSIQNFVVKTMLQCEEELCVGEVGFRLPDHSVLLWDLMADGVVSEVSYMSTEEGPHKKLVVPENYMCGQEDFIASIVDRLKRMHGDQGELDTLYSDLMEGLKSGLKEVHCGGKKHGQVWFSKELKAMRKEMHRKEKQWLERKASEEQKHLRNEYLKARATYSKAVKKAKRDHQKRSCKQLERDLGCPKKFWRALKKMNFGKGKKQGRDLLQVYDEGGSIKSGEEAIEIWKNHFAKVRGRSVDGDGETSGYQIDREEKGSAEFSQWLCEPISREEVLWALNEVKKDAAPGLDGVVMDMMLTERLFEVWVALFEVCWEHGMVPSSWRESVVVPVPKGKAKGVCNVNAFRGISLTSLVSKVVCKILEQRLSSVAEERGLIVEEQGGFRKRRGCRDQLLSLVLLGQTEMVRKPAGMLVAFIDFAKAYDKVDQEKLWSCLQSVGVNGRFLRFLQALYDRNVCRVKVNGHISEEFEVHRGLRQGCVLSPLLFSLYINSAVKRLKEERCGVECGDEIVPGLLFADDTCLIASDGPGIERSLEVLVEWCKEWGVKINVAKSGIMHIRKKKVERSEVVYEVDGEAISMVSSYKYLGCVVDEYLELTEMMGDKAESGKRALGACLQRCREEIGEVGVGVFQKLMGSLVESGMMYGVEIWGCSRRLEPIEQVQLRALRQFFGVGILHPKVSLLFEMRTLPVVWEAKIRCVRFWLKVLTSEMYEGRLLRKLARQAVECGKGAWVKNMAKCCVEFGWQGMEADAIKDLSELEIRDMLSSIAWRKVGNMWKKEMEERPKLGMLNEIAALEYESSCAVVERKRDRNMMMKLRGGTAAFQIEVGRWKGVVREQRVCKECSSGDVEDVCHWMLRCPAWDSLRQPLVDEVSQHDCFQGQCLEKQTASVLSMACTKYSILNYLSAMWCARFGL